MWCYQAGEKPTLQYFCMFIACFLSRNGVYHWFMLQTFLQLDELSEREFQEKDNDPPPASQCKIVISDVQAKWDKVGGCQIKKGLVELSECSASNCEDTGLNPDRNILNVLFS